jgi:hypothetical protein
VQQNIVEVCDAMGTKKGHPSKETFFPLDLAAVDIMRSSVIGADGFCEEDGKELADNLEVVYSLKWSQSPVTSSRCGITEPA